MNLIILEGMNLCLFLILLGLMMLISIGSLICAMIADKKIILLNSLLIKEKENVRFLNKENLKFKLKYGELEQDE